jgi:predicted nucleic acid-binding protein
VRFLLDTNVVSDWVKPQPNAGLKAWLAGADEDSLYLSVVTIAELKRGAERLPAGRRRKALETWLHRDILLRFERRILAIDVAIAETWGRVTARCEDIGRPIGSIDAFIAATAELYDLTLVTRNDSDFRTVVKSVLNPWT